jgi:thiamine transporter ThiT
VPGTTPDQRGTDGVAIAALVTGLIALLASFVPFVGALFSVPFALAAVVLGIMAMRRRVQRGFGVAGLVLGILALLITVAWWALLIPFRTMGGFEEFGDVSLLLPGLLALRSW